MQDLERIASRIFAVRGQRVMLDADLAALYGASRAISCFACPFRKLRV
jgi:hypothetical protein